MNSNKLLNPNKGKFVYNYIRKGNLNTILYKPIWNRTLSTTTGKLLSPKAHHQLYRRPTLRTLPITAFRRHLYSTSRRNGMLPSIWNLIPPPVKAFGVIATTAAAFFFISVPLIIICGPPLALAFWLYTRRLRKIANELYHQRWNNMGTYHLTFNDILNSKETTSTDDLFSILSGNKSGDAERIARNRILEALENNEQGLATELSISSTSIDNIALTNLEGIQQDFRASSQGLQEKLEIRSLGLINKQNDNRIANVNLVIQTQTSNPTNKKMRIEIEPLNIYGAISNRFILDESSSNSEDTIIDIDPKHYRRTK